MKQLTSRSLLVITHTNNDEISGNDIIPDLLKTIKSFYLR